MNEYEITYRYNMIGYQTVKANNIKEAREKHFEEDYGDCEDVIIGSHCVSKVRKINNK